MRVPSLHRLAAAAGLALVLSLTLAAPAAQAAGMPNAMRKVALTARELPVAAFLQNLFASVDVPADVSPELAGTVNGTFTGSAQQVLRDVSRVYNLVSYYDGSVMHVVPASALVRRTYAATPQEADRMLRTVAELDLTDARNSLRRASDGSMQAFGTKRFVEQLDELFRAGQARQAAPPPPPAAADFRVFYLRYAWAQDVTMTLGGRQVVVPGVASILRSLVGAHPGAPLGRETMLRPTQPGLRGQGLASQGAGARDLQRDPVGDGGFTRTGAADGGRDGGRAAAVDVLVAALARTAQPPEPAPVAAPAALQVRIEADPRLNAIIVRDQADRLARYEQLIAALDVEPQSVEIEATIIDINTDRMRELGVDWRGDRSGKSLAFGGGVATTGAGGIASIVVGSVTQFFARIRALQAEGAARVVSSPQIVTLSNVEAIFDNSSTFYVRVAGREQVDLFNVSAGTSLRVTPNVFRDRDATRIKLMVNVEDGNLTGRQVDQIPVVERSTINTQALIAEGESLLIGGMVRDSTSTSVDKVPGLGDVPVVGNLFKTQNGSSSRVERMFLITPRIAGSRPPAARSEPTQLQAVPAGVMSPAPAASRAVEPTAPPVPPAVPAAPPLPIAGPGAVAAGAPPAYVAPAGVPGRRASVEVDLDAMPAGQSPVALRTVNLLQLRSR